MSRPVTLVEFSLYNTESPAGEVYLCVSNIGLHSPSGGQAQTYHPRLLNEVEISRSVQIAPYGESVGADIEVTTEVQIALDADLYPYLSYIWIGREVTVRLGTEGEDSYATIVAGRVAGVRHTSGILSVSIVSAVLDVDAPLVDDLYDNTFPAPLQERPIPYAAGTVRNIAPSLIDPDTQTYQAAAAGQIADTTDLTVGGLPWTYTAGTPAQGQWTRDDSAGTVTLGAVPLNFDVRVDALATGYATLTTGQFLEDLVEGANGTVDSASITALDATVTGLLGYWTDAPVTVLQVIDEVCLGSGVVRYPVPSSGAMGFAAIAAPGSATETLTSINVMGAELIEVLPPARRIRIEYDRNWSPSQQLSEVLSDDDRQEFTASGTVAEAYTQDILTIHPRAVDVPLIRSLFTAEAGANTLRTRLADAWGVERKIYQIQVVGYEQGTFEIMDSVEIDFEMISGAYRVIGISEVPALQIATLTVWG